MCVATYGQRFPQRPSELSARIIPSLVISLPLIALARVVADFARVAPDPLAVPYLVIVVLLALSAGQLAGVAINSDPGRRALSWLGISGPERSVSDRVLRRLPENEFITVTFRDGRILSGFPRHGTNDPDTQRQELFMTQTSWYSGLPKAPWLDRRSQGGVLINFDDVAIIGMDVDAG
ncbi:MAG: hypothetical protein H7247_03925 [Polaromonas sp.]|nr:hypothetical protein [Gemmatimonadaceae bacterium]